MKMTRFALPPLLRKRLRFYQPMDVYRHCPLPIKERSIEHLIPVSLTPTSSEVQLEPMHLYITSPRMNGFRSNYRFGGDREEVWDPHWKELDGCFKNSSRRVFFPARGHRLVAHVIWKMMDRYPFLRDYEDKCFENMETWDRWLKKPWTPMERHVLENNQDWNGG